MNPKTYKDVRREREEFLLQNPGLEIDTPTFAKLLDELDGQPTRQLAYNDNLLKQFDYGANKTLELTRLPQAGRWAGEGLGSLVGAPENIQQVLGDVGEFTPRVGLEGLLTMLAPEATLPRYAARALGYGTAAARGYTDTDSVAGAVIAPAQLALNNWLIPKAGNAVFGKVQDYLNRKIPKPNLGPVDAPDMTTTILQKGGAAQAMAQRLSPVPVLAKEMAEMAVGTGLGEATRQGMLSAQGVPLLDEQRNPFTAENVVANVAGNLAFAPLYVKSFMDRPKTNLSAVTSVQDWRNKRQEWLKTQDVSQHPEGQRQFTAAEVNDRLTALEAAMAVLDRHTQEGNVEFADAARGHIKRLLQGVGRNELTDPKYKQVVDDFAVKSTEAAPDTPQAWATFMNEYNTIVDQLFGPREGGRERPLEQLQREGYLPKATPEFLAEQFNWSDDRSLGDPRFAARAVAQKMGNLLKAGYDTALAKRAAERKVEVEPTPSERRRNEAEIDMEEAYHAALLDLPKEVGNLKVRSALLQRHVEIQDALDKQGSTSGMLGGVGHSYYSGWRDLVIQASQTYDPTTGTFTYRTPQKTVTPEGKTVLLRDAEGKPVFKTETRRLTELFERKPGTQSYVLYPSPKRIPTWQGGKGGMEVSIDKPLTPEGGSLHDVVPDGGDELSFWSQLVTGAEGGAMRGKRGVKGFMQDPEGGIEPGIAVPTPEEQSQLAIIGEQLKDKLNKLTDSDVWNMVRGLYEQVNPNGMVRANSLNSFRARTMKVALRALGEELAVQKQGAKSAEAPLGTDGQLMYDLMVRRGTIVPKEGVTPRTQLIQGLQTYFRRGNTSSMNDQIKEVMYRIVGPENLKDLAGGNAPVPTRVNPWTGKQRIDAAGGYTTVAQTPDNANFARDFYTTYRSTVSQHFDKLGYSGTTKDMLIELAAAVAASSNGLEVNFYRLVSDDKGTGGLFTPNTNPGLKDRIGVKMGFEKTGPVYAQRTAERILRDVLHELAHYEQFVQRGLIPMPDAYSDQTKRILDGFYSLADKMTNAERAVIFATLRDSLLPDEPKFRQNYGSGERGYGLIDPMQPAASTATEFGAQMRALIDISLLVGKPGVKKTVEDVFRFMPAEVEQYARLQYRTLADVLDAAREAASKQDPSLPFGAVKERNNSTALKLEQIALTARALSAFRDMDLARAAGKKLVAELDPGALGVAGGTAGVLEFFKLNTKKILDDSDMPFTAPKTVDNAHAAVEEAVKSIRFADRTERGARPTLMQRLYPFYNLMHAMERAGVPIAGDVWNLAAGVTPAIHRIESAILRPFLTLNAQGKYEFDGNNALIARIAEDPKGEWRRGFNLVRRFQNEHKFEPVYIKGQDGKITVNPDLKGAQKLHDGLVAKFSPEDMTAIMNGSVAMDETYQLAAATLVKSLNDSVVNRVAASLMAANRRMTSQEAKLLAGEVVAGFMTGNLDAVGAKVPKQQLDSLGSLLTGEDGLLTQFDKVQKDLLKRKGFSSEQLPYDWMVRYLDEDGNTKYLSAETEKAARRLAEGLIGRGLQLDGEIFNRRDVDKYNEFDSPDEVLSKFIDLERKAWDKYLVEVERTQGQEAANAAREAYMPGESSEKELMRRGVKKYLMTNEGKVDRKRYDYLEGMANYANRFAASVAFRSIRQELNLLMNDPRGKAFPTFKQQVADHFDFMFSPTSKTVSEMKSMASAYYLGANLSSALVEGSQSLITLVPTLINLDTKGRGLGAAYRQLWSSIKDMRELSGKDWQSRANSALRKQGGLTADEERAVMYKRAVEDGIIDHGAIQDLDLGRDQRLLLTAKFGRGEMTDVTPGQMVWDKAYLLSQHMMRFYSWTALANNKISFLAGIRHGQELGLTGDALYAHARKVKDLSTFGGGKANMPTFVSQWSSPYTRNAFVTMYTLQQYAMGMFATYAEMIKDSFGSKLPPLQRVQARKSLATMMMTQTALAGAFGLPFAAAMLTILEKTFGIEAHRAVREGLTALGGEDENGEPTEAGRIIADVALNGLGNQLFGIDLSSRVGTSNLFGTSSYRGFNMMDALGPVPGLMENLYTGLSEFGQGQPMKAAKALVPQAFKNTFEMADTVRKYGDTAFRDTGGNLMYQPSAVEVGAYLFGFRPSEVSRRRQAQQMIMTSEDIAMKERQRDINRAAQALIRGDASVAESYARDMVSANPNLSREDVMRSVLRQVADSTIERDMARNGLQTNAEGRRDIAALYGPKTAPQASELQRTMVMMQTAMQMGQPQLVKPQQFTRAAFIDNQMAQGKTRVEAAQLADRLGL